MVHELAHLQPLLTVHTNSCNTVEIWNSLKVSKIYNVLLHIAIDSMICNSLDVHVLHVPSIGNLITDALLWGNNSFVQHLAPNLTVHTFNPLMIFWGLLKNSSHPPNVQATTPRGLDNQLAKL